MNKSQYAFLISSADVSADHDRTAAFENLAKVLEHVAAARAGFADLKARSLKLEEQASDLRKQQSTVGGAALASKVLGLSECVAQATSVDVAGVRSKLNGVEEELRQVTAAIAAAPELFGGLLNVLSEADRAAWSKHNEAKRGIEEWCEVALSVGAAIQAEIVFLRDFISRSPAGLSAPSPLKSLNQTDFETLTDERALLARAKAEERPLVLAPPPPPVSVNEESEEWERRHAELQARNAEAARQWHEEREARTERQRKEKYARVLATQEPRKLVIER
jgi:hypothetical protein